MASTIFLSIPPDLSSGVLVIYCYITNYHKLSSSKRHTFIISQRLQIRNLDMAKSDPLLKSLPQAAIKMLSRVGSHLGAQQEKLTQWLPARFSSPLAVG